jgi:hypothetical protein
MSTRGRRLATGLSVLAAGVVLASCSEVEEGSAGGYEPSRLDAIEGSRLKRVTLTREGAERTGLRTATVQRSGRHLVVPYAALIYDGEGRSFVYTSPEPLTFVRAAVAVDRIAGDRVLLTRGPPRGSDIVTVGATEVYGAELEIAGGH